HTFVLTDTPTTAIYTLSYTTLFRSRSLLNNRTVFKHKDFIGILHCTEPVCDENDSFSSHILFKGTEDFLFGDRINRCRRLIENRSEEHTSELQSRENLVCRLLLEKK